MKKIVKYSFIDGRRMPECIIEGGFFSQHADDVWAFNALGVADMSLNQTGVVQVFESESEVLDYVGKFYQDADYVDDLGNHRQYRVREAVGELYAKVA